MKEFKYQKGQFQYYMGDLRYILAWRHKETGKIFPSCPKITKKIWVFSFQINDKENYERCLCHGTYSYSKYSSSSKGWGNISGYGMEPLGYNIDYDFRSGSKHIYEVDMLRMPEHYLWENHFYIQDGRLMSKRPGLKGRVHSAPEPEEAPDSVTQ